MMKKLTSVFILMMLIGCSGIKSPAERSLVANQIATQHNLTGALVGDSLPLQAFYSSQAFSSKHNRIYIEGDGFAYVTSSVPSPDPTPLEPTTLRLAASDTNPNIIYLARPCHYTTLNKPNCPQKYWTTHRYSQAVVDIYHNILNTFKSEHGVQTFDVVGYSGGGVIAALLAAQRNDVTALRTVASNLDVAAFTTHHGITPMPHSRNPADVDDATFKNLPQKHFSGGDDDIVPPQIARSFVQQTGASLNSLEVVKGMDHFSPWHEIWPNLLTKSLQSLE